MTTLREAAEMALGTLQDVCARLLYRGHPDQIALEQARQTIQALKQATEQSKQKRDPIDWNGWIVREVLFDEGEPVGHREYKPLTDETIGEVVIQDTLHHGYAMAIKPHIQGVLPKGTKLYTSPPQRKPLTDEEIDKVTDAQWAQNNHKPIYAAHRAYARAIEKAHGIGEKE